MKKNALTILLVTIAAALNAQLVVGFENFGLMPNSAYSSTASAPFQEGGLSFNHKQAFSFWAEGFAYTNKYDSLTAGYTNLYGVRAGKGRNQSATYAMGQMRGVVTISSPQNTVAGFYVTNSTYAYFSIRDGDQFARKFGDTTGTGSGTTIPQGAYPDFFKLIVRAYQGGNLKPDSVTFFLADYRSTNDYIVSTWQYVNTTSLGSADSLIFTLRSSDNGQFGMNTPGFFGIDEVNIQLPNPVTVAEKTISRVKVWPNPFHSQIHVPSAGAGDILVLRDINGMVIRKTEGAQQLDRLEDLPAGFYFLSIINAAGSETVPLFREP